MPAQRSGELTLLSMNAYVGQADAAAVARVVREREDDVLVVVEASPAFVRRLDAEGLGRTHPYHVLTRGLAVEHVDTVRVPGSDHDAILVDLVW